MKSSIASGITRLSLSAWRPFIRTLKSTRAVQRFTFLARFFASVLDLLDFSLRISNPIYQSSTTLFSFFLARIPFDITPFPGVAISVKASAAEVTKRPEVTLSLFSLVLGGNHLIDDQLALNSSSLSFSFSFSLQMYHPIQLYGTLASLIIVKFL